MFSVLNPPSLKAVVLLIFAFAALASATNFTYIYNSSNPAFYSLESGTTVNSGYNSTLSAYALNGTNATGSYLSPVLDAGANSTWVNISFAQKYCYGQNLPNLGGSYSGCTNSPNMSGNVFLLHFDNQADMGENSTFVADYSGSYTNGTCTNSTVCPAINSTQTKLLGTSASFNGTQYYTFSDILESTFNGQSGSTIMMWVRPESAAANIMMLSKLDSVAGNRQFFVRYMTTQKFDLVFYSVNSGATFREYTSTPTYPVNNWYHVAFVFNISGDSYTLYVNGAAAAGVKAGSAITSMANSAEEILVGATNNGGANQFKGVLDEVSIWNRMLSSTEVSNLYKMQANRYNVSIKTCANSDCSDQPSFGVTYNTTPKSLALSPQRYLQYNISMATDSSGNTSEITNVTFYAQGQNSDSPIVTINSPTNNSNQSSTTLTLNFSASTGGTLSSCVYSINGTANVSVPGCLNNTSNQTTVTVSSGFNQNVTVWITDTFGHVSNATKTFNVDTSGPVITVNAPTSGLNQTSNTLTINFSAVDPVGLSSCWYSINGTTNVSVPGCFNSTTNQTTTSVITGIAQNITIYVNDSVGNLASSTVNFNINYNFTYLYVDSTSGIYTLESGSLFKTAYNATSGYASLVASNTSGSYLSPVFDAGNNATWANISWGARYNYGANLPSNGAVESGYISNVNMTGNMLLLHFDNTTSENNTLVSEFSGNNYNGWCVPSGDCPVLNTTNPKFGRMHTYNGTTKFRFGDILESTMNGNSTVAAWIYPTSTTSEFILSKYSAVTGQVRTQWFFAFIAGAFKLYRYGTTSGTTYRIYATTNTFSANNWYHVVFISEPATDTYTIYVDGVVEAGSKSGTGAIATVPDTAQSVYVGTADHNTPTSYGFNGEIDEVAVWNRTLSAAEVTTLYQRGFGSLNVSVKTCTSSDCSDQPTFAATYNGTPQNLTLNPQRYLQYNVSISAVSAGESPELSNVTLYSALLGVAAPDITVNSPVNNSNQSSTSLTLNFSAVTASTLHTCWYSVNGTANINVPGCVNATTNQTSITVSSGLNQNVTVYANDTLGNIGSLTRIFNIDSAAPVITVNSPVNNTYSPSNQMLFNASISDAYLDSCWYSVNGGSNTTFTCNGAAFNITVTSGISTIYVYANDTLGQNGSAGAYYFNYSNSLALTGNLNTTSTSPLGWVNITGALTLANGSTIPNNNVSIYVDGVPATLMTAGWWNNSWNYRKLINITENSGANLTDFQYNFSFDTRVLISQGYMQSNCSDIRFTDVNGNALSYFIESGCNTTTTNIWVKSNLSASTTNTIYLYYGNTLASAGSDPDGTFILYDDFNGSSVNSTKWSASGSVTYTVSNSIYQVTDSSLSWLAQNGLNASSSNYQGIYFELRNVNWSHVTSDLFTLELIFYNTSGAYNTLGIGIQDSHGATSEGYLYSHIANSGSAGATNYDNSQVNLIGTRAENGAVTYYVNGSSKRTGNTNATFDKIILATSKNAAGPYPTTDVGLVWVRTFSSSMPSLSFNSSQESNVSATNVVQTNVNGQYSVILVAPSLPGVKNVSLTSSFANAVGNTSSNLTVNGALNLTVLLPVNNTNQTTTSLTLNFSINSPLSTDTCQYSINSTNNVTIPGCANGSNQASITVSNGLNQNITLYVNDTTGNLASATRNFNVDSIAPTIALTAPTNNSLLSSASVDLNVSVTDATSNVDSCLYSVNGTANVTFTCANNATFTTTSGNGNITVYVNDSFGNYNSTIHYFTVSIVTAPTHGTPILNSTDNSNITTQNLTVYNVSTSDAEGDAVKNIINWYLNDTSITTLNWQFDGGSNSTSTPDYSNNNYTGEVTGAEYKSNTARDGFGTYNFTNASTYIVSPSVSISSLLKSNFTIAFWANPGAASDRPTFGFASSGRFNSANPFASYDGALNVGDGSSYQILGALPVAGANTWTYYAIVDNGTHYSVYVNGSLSVSTAITINPAAVSSRRLILGQSGFDTPYDQPFAGQFDEFIIYGRALSPAQINALYYNESNKIVSNELSGGQSWNACITPNDKTVDGYTKCSNSLYIQTTPDVTAPVVSITLPTNNTNQTSTSLNLTFTATDSESSLSSCWYSINSTTNVTVPGCVSASPNSTLITVSSGSNQNITVYANDTAGNIGSAIKYFNINSAPTHATPTLNSTDNSNTTSQNLTVYNVSTSDAEGDAVKNIINWYINETSFENIIMPFDGDGNNATFAKDYSGYAANGTVNGGATWSGTSGFDGKGAYTLDGVDDYISIPNNTATDIRGNLTIAFWTKNTVAPSQFDSILMKTSSTSWTDGYGFFYNSNNQVRFFVSNYGSNVAVASLTATNWNHIVGTYDGSTVRIYINGVEGTSDAYSGAISGTSAALEIGRGGSNVYNINGIIDEFRLYDEALSASEVLALYQNRSNTITSDHLTTGSSWRACITPNDGLTDGITKCSNNLTVLSSMPADVTAPVITINAPTNNTNQSSTTLMLNFSATDASSFTCWYSVNLTSNVTVPGCVNATTNQTTIAVSNSLNQNVTVWVNDSSGNLASATRTFNIDATAPLLNVILPVNSTNQTSTVLAVNITASDSGIGLDSCWYSINNTANVTFVCADNATVVVTAGNNQNVTVYVNDSVGNLNSSTKYFNIDTISPTISINSPGNNTNQSSTTLTINFSATDVNSISNCWYSINGTTNVTIAGCVSGLTNQTTATVSAQLAQNVTIYANDSFGNLASSTRTFNIDNTAPTITVNSPVNNSNLSSSTLTINFSAVDQLPLSACWYSINGTNNVSITGCVNATTNQTITVVTAGSAQNITIYANDSLGNLVSETRTFNYIAVNPIITINSPVNNSNQTSTNLILNFSVYAGAVLDTCKYSLNGAANVTIAGCVNSTTNQTTVVVSNGLNQNMIVYANDTNGNAATSVIYFGIDNQAPSIVLALPANNSNQSSASLRINVSVLDLGVGIDSCMYSINGTTNVTFTCADNATATITNGLTQNVTVYVNDSLGNLNATTHTFNIDNAAPDITINLPVNNTNQSSTTLTLNFSATDASPLSTCWYSVNSTTNITIVGCVNNTSNQTTVLVSNSLNQNVTVWVNDSLGNLASLTRTFNINSNAPVITINAPANNTNQSSTTLTINFSALTTGTLDTCMYSVNDTANVTIVGCVSGLTNQTTTTVTAGDNQNVTIYVNDTLGNAARASRIFSIDQTSPIITINSPVNNSNLSSSTLTINFSAIDTYGLSSCWYAINSTTNVTVNGCANATTNQTTATIAPGLNQNITFYVNDSVGNIASITRTFNYVTSAPLVTINSPINNVNQTSTSLTLNFSANGQTTIDSCWYSINNTVNITVSGCVNATTNQTIVTVTNGLNQNVTVYVNDTMGSTGNAISYFNIDNIPPSITVNLPANNTNQSSTTLTLNFSATDESALNSCWYSINNTNNVSVNGCVNGTTNQTAISVTTGLAQNITLYVNDSFGNTASVIRTFNVDATAPVVTINAPTNYQNQSATSLVINFSVSTPNTISSCWYSINGTNNVTVPGCVSGITNQTTATITTGLNQNITIYANDTLGNLGSTIKVFSIDNAAPALVVYLPVNNTNQSSTNLAINISAFDAGLGVDICWYSVNNTANVTFACANNATVTVTNGNNQNVTIYVNDTVGNQNSTTHIFNINNAAPVITINAPINNTNQSSTTLTLNFSATTSDVLDTCQYSINGTTNATIVGCINATTNQSLIPVSAGLNQNVTVYVNDSLGNSASLTQTFSIDTTAPTIVFNLPLNNSNQSSTILTINFSAIDDSGLSSCWYSINGTNNVTVPGCVNATTNQTTATISSGNVQNITIYVNDSVGNLASATRTFNYDTNAPTITINSPINYQNQSATSLVINFSATTTNTIDTCWYSINNTLNTTIACTNATTVQTTATVVEGINQNVTIYANDTIGNTASSTVYFTVDQTAPAISVNSPEYNANLSSSPLTINFSATDAVSISTCWYSINSTSNVTIAGCVSGLTNQTTATITTGLNQNITIYANDSLGNIAAALIPFNYVQTSSINLTINTPIDNQNQASTTLAVNFTLASSSAISTCWYNLNNTVNVTIAPCTNNADNLLSIIASNGLNQNITIYANDSTGNLTSAIKAFHIDSIAPTIAINLPANNTNYASTNLTINFTATDTTTVSTCWYSINSTTNVTVPGCTSGVSNQFQINATLTTGQNITVWANDSFGNTASTTHYFGIDLSATVITVNLPVNNTNQSFDTLTLNFSAQNNYGISTCWYSINNTANITVNGCANATTNQTTITVSNSTAQTITIYANDTFGNETSVTKTFNIDPTKPNITINTPTNYTNLSSSTLVLNFTPTDNYAIHTCIYSINGTTNTTLSCTNSQSTQTSTTITAGLNQNVTVYVNDSAGNLNSSTVYFNYTASNLNVTINSPVNNTNQTTNAITLNFTPASTLDISTCMYSINNTANVTVPGCISGQSNETNLTLTEGANQNVTIYVNDSNANWATTTHYFNIDATAPHLFIYAPTNASTTTDTTISITYSVSDTGVGVQNCYYSLNGAANVTIANCQNTTITPGLGTHNLTIYANDSLGNLNQSQLITFTLNQAPAPSSGGGGSGGSGGSSGGSASNNTSNNATNDETFGQDNHNVNAQSQHAILVNEEYVVNMTFNPDSTVISIDFKPKEDATGTLILLLPLSFEDYQNGLITIRPSPTRVERSANGIKAYYENISVLTSIGFKAQVTVKSALSKGVVKEFKITFINANISRGFDLENNPVAQNYVPVAIVVLAIILGVIYWAVIKKKNNSTPTNN